MKDALGHGSNGRDLRGESKWINRLEDRIVAAAHQQGVEQARDVPQSNLVPAQSYPGFGQRLGEVLSALGVG